ncbi:hypothetical protein HY496_02790 [Candidatus Woesearchaeota archaeon]|nr:hypothetical protein [Candidatus Woesearchaeota archaeon]
MIRQKILLLILALSLLLLTSCGTNQQQSQAKSVFIGGTQGLSAQFEPFGIEENGVFYVFDTETFPIELTVTNKGEYDFKAGDVSVTLLGPSPTEFSGIPAWQLKNKGTIEKISDLSPSGGQESINFATDAKYLAPVTGAIERNWFANLDYNYQTYVIVPEVCLKEDQKDQRVCQVKGVKTFFVSGAPITVTGVEEDTAGQAIMALKFKVRNAIANSKVAKPQDEFSSTANKFAFSLDDPAWDCSSTGKVGEGRFDEKGEATVLCKLKQPLAKGTLSTKQVKLTLDYKYREIVQEKLLIKQSVK